METYIEKRMQNMVEIKIGKISRKSNLHVEIQVVCNISFTNQYKTEACASSGDKTKTLMYKTLGILLFVLTNLKTHCLFTRTTGSTTLGGPSYYLGRWYVLLTLAVGIITYRSSGNYYIH